MVKIWAENSIVRALIFQMRIILFRTCTMVTVNIINNIPGLKPILSAHNVELQR